ncbi:transposase [Micromonospora sp. NPDC002717]|uniref:transposase n=1 Tax=Micromonospora sp. NPDC002717 TaxID=3154424 RepID=UPI003324FA81
MPAAPPPTCLNSTASSPRSRLGGRRSHAFLHTGITNSGSEGTNRVIKTIARDAYGSRNRRTSAYASAPPPPDAAADTSTH